MLSYFSMNRAMTALVVLVVQWFALPSVNAEQPPTSQHSVDHDG